MYMYTDHEENSDQITCRFAKGTTNTYNPTKIHKMYNPTASLVHNPMKKEEYYYYYDVPYLQCIHIHTMVPHQYR